MMRRARIRTFVAVLALVGTAGSTAGVAAADQASLSKPEYISAADDICGQGTQRESELAASTFADLKDGEKPTTEQITQYVQGFVPIVDSTLAQLKSLPKPPGDAKKLNKIYKILGKAFDKIEKHPTLLLATKSPTAKADKLAQKYGFQVCGQSQSG
jgi:hypothetical protein